MKRMILLISLATFVISEKQDLIQYGEKCAEELGLGPSDLSEFKEKILSRAEMNHNSKCMARCTAEKAGLIVDGVLNEAAVSKCLPDGVDLEKCKALTGDDDCDKFYKIFRCLDKEKLEKSTM
uniref:Odorant binding protein 17 n=1 Tax=Holotrichia oblita TaxID=644536 RepID=A0A3S8UUN1_HOLOL|nr:odorant binding protein 17 [Holotrichia oblita]